jgi:hypothetical protein
MKAYGGVDVQTHDTVFRYAPKFGMNLLSLSSEQI